MTYQDKHTDDVVQEIQRIADEAAETLVEIHRNDADGTAFLDIGIDHLCRQTLRNLGDTKFRKSWTQFYSIYNGDK